MIYVMCSAIVTKDNEFKVKTLYISSEESSWIVTEGQNWEPLEQSLDLATMKLLSRSQKFSTSQITYSPIRQIDDSDAKSFANFLKDKLRKTFGAEFSKKLFKTMSNIGEEVSNGSR